MPSRVGGASCFLETAESSSLLQAAEERLATRNFTFRLGEIQNDLVQRSAFALYTCCMNKLIVQAKSSTWFQVLIVLAVTFTCFFLSGGQHLNFSDFPPHRSQGDDIIDDIQVYIGTFIYCGGAGALAGAVVSTVILLAVTKKEASPSQEP